MKKQIHYAWFILILVFIGILAAQGVRLSFGAFIQPWERDFSTTRETISLISMVSFVVYGILQPVFGKLTDRYGIRKILTWSILLVGISTLSTSFVTSSLQLAIVYGIISSIGFGGTSGVIATVAVTNWFKEKRGLAFGIVEAAFGAGQMIIVPASLFLIDSIGWKSTALMMGFFLIIIVAPLVYLFIKSKPSDMGLNPYGEGVEEINSNKFVVEDKKAPFFLVIRTREFWFLILPFFICGFTTSGLMDTHLIPFCHDMGYTDQVTGTAVGLLAAFNILGTVLSGKMADRWSNRLMLAHLYFIRAVSILILLYTNQPTWLLLFSIIFGFVDFATVAPTQLLTTHYFKNYSVGLILGWIYLAHQIGSSLGSYIPGLLYNWYGSYKISFFSSIALLFFASILSLLLPEPKSTNKKIHLQEEMGT